jgi:hypothetical protein
VVKSVSFLVNILLREILEANTGSRAAGQGGDSRAKGEYYLDATPGDPQSKPDSRPQCFRLICAADSFEVSEIASQNVLAFSDWNETRRKAKSRGLPITI